MKVIKSFLINFLQITIIGFSTSCFGQEVANAPSEILFVGSTPGDTLIKSLLAVPASTKVDFIRWHLALDHKKENQNSFRLNISFGEALPNTLGFKRGGEKRTFHGLYAMDKSKNGKLTGHIYHLKSSDMPSGVSLIQVNSNLLHLLTPQNELMVGNGGWSYTLNRANPMKTAEALPALTDLSTLQMDTVPQVFEGRTPCFPFAIDHGWPVTSGCLKLKWKVILHKSSIPSEPGTFSMRRIVNNEAGELLGTWQLLKGTASDSEAMIYRLTPDNSETPVSLLLADDNVLFLLDNDGLLYTGNADFSFTLNKRE